MSLYTPLFTSSPTKNSAGASGSTQHTQKYIDFLRGVHLFLSTQGEEWSPPSRPSSPNFEKRVSSLTESVRETLIAAKFEPAKGEWTRVCEQLKMGCLRGKHYAACNDGQGPLEETAWILPETEEEWFELEKERQGARRLKKQAIQAQLSNTTPSSLASAASRSHNVPPVSPNTRRLAKEKVKRWQAMMVQEAPPDSEHAQMSLTPSVDIMATKGKAVVPRKSNSLNFPVVKRSITVVDGKKGHSVPVRPSTSKNGGDVVNSVVQSVTPGLSIGEKQPTVPYDGRNTPPAPNSSRKVLCAASAKPKISDFPETPYLPPSFPSQIHTSTPHPAKLKVPFRAKPPPILPCPPSSSTPPPHTPVEGGCDEKVLRVANPLSAPLLDAPQLRHPYLSSPDRPIGSPVAPLKERSTSRCQPLPALPPPVLEGGFTGEYFLPPAGVKEGGMAISDIFLASVGTAPDDHGTRQSLAEKNPSPAKSHFSSHAASPSPSPEPSHNILFSPGSPIFPFAKGFQPPYASTQDGPHPQSRAGSGLFGMGYSSQFDVEHHIERVAKVLDKEVDFDSWLNDLNPLSGAGSSV